MKNVQYFGTHEHFLAMTWVKEGRKKIWAGWLLMALAPAEGGSIRREGSAGESLALAQWGRRLGWQRCWKF